MSFLYPSNLAGHIHYLQSLPSQGFSNFISNLSNFSAMSTLQWVRIIAIVGGYLLLRPYITQFVEKTQAKQMTEAEEEARKKEEDEEREAEELIKRGIKKAKPEISQEAMRMDRGWKEEVEGKKKEREENGDGSAWGAKAKKKQAALIKKAIEQEERERRELAMKGGWDSEEDKDIEQYLT